jgi:hypothetical protein
MIGESIAVQLRAVRMLSWPVTVQRLKGSECWSGVLRDSNGQDRSLPVVLNSANRGDIKLVGTS